MVELIVQFTRAHAKWRKAGKPQRSPERMKEIHDNYCTPCPYGAVESGVPRCTLCECCISSNRLFLNKLAYATEACPDGRWDAEVDENLS